MFTIWEIYKHGLLECLPQNVTPVISNICKTEYYMRSDAKFQNVFQFDLLHFSFKLTNPVQYMSSDK